MAFTISFLMLALFCLSVVTSFPSRDKRSDDVAPLAAVVSGNSQQIQQLTAQVTALQNTFNTFHDKAALHVAFYAMLSYESTVHLQRGQTLRFDFVYTNQASAYDKDTGIFTAPVSGLYAFYLSTKSTDSAHTGSVYLHFPKVPPMNALFVETDNMGTAHGVFHMNQGDRTWVEGNNGNINLYSYDTALSGFLLSPDY